MKNFKSFADKLKIAAVTGLCLLNFSGAEAGELLAQIDADLKGDGSTYTVKLEGSRLTEKADYFRDLMLVVKDSEGHMRSAWKPNLDGAYNCILAKIPEPVLNSKKESIVLIAGQGGAENLPVWRIIDFGKDGAVRELFSAEDSLGLTVRSDYIAGNRFTIECESPLTNDTVSLQGKAGNVYGVFNEDGEPVKGYLKPVVSPVISLVEDAEKQNVLYGVQDVYAADLRTVLGEISYELILKEAILPDGSEKLMWMPENIVLHAKYSEDNAAESAGSGDKAGAAKDAGSDDKAGAVKDAGLDDKAGDAKAAGSDKEKVEDGEKKAAEMAEEADEKIIYNRPVAAGNWQVYPVIRYDKKDLCNAYPVVSVEAEPELQNKINEQIEKWRNEGAFSAEAKYRVAFAGEQLMSLVCFRKDISDNGVKTDVAIFNFDMRTGKNLALKDMFDLKNKDFKEVLNLAGQPAGAFEEGNAAVWFYDGDDFYFADEAGHLVETDKLWGTAAESKDEAVDKAATDKAGIDKAVDKAVTDKAGIDEAEDKVAVDKDEDKAEGSVKDAVPTQKENVEKALEIMGEDASKLQTEAVKETIMHAADSQMQEIADAMARMEKAKANLPRKDINGRIIPYTKVDAADMYVFVKDKSMPAHPEKEDAAARKLELVQKALQEEDDKTAESDSAKGEKNS